MIKRRTIFDFLGNVFMIYGITVLVLVMLCGFVGDEAVEISSMFRRGNDGLALDTMFQFFLMVVLLVSYEWLLLTDLVIKNWTLVIRTICMFALTIITVGIFAALFDWFPVNMVEAWVAFLLSFFVCATVSIVVSVLKERSENKKLQEALEHLKEGED